MEIYGYKLSDPNALRDTRVFLNVQKHIRSLSGVPNRYKLPVEFFIEALDDAMKINETPLKMKTAIKDIVMEPVANDPKSVRFDNVTRRDITRYIEDRLSCHIRHRIYREIAIQKYYEGKLSLSDMDVLAISKTNTIHNRLRDNFQNVQEVYDYLKKNGTLRDISGIGLKIDEQVKYAVSFVNRKVNNKVRR